MRSSARGTIVNLSSMYGHKCTVSNTAYGSSKHGVLGITKNVSSVILSSSGAGSNLVYRMQSITLVTEYGLMQCAQGISLTPANHCRANEGSFIETPMTCRPEGPSPGMRNYLATVPMARIGQPEEVRHLHALPLSWEECIN